MLTFAVEVAHWSALVPLAVLAVFRRQAGAGYWLLAVAFACSFAADTITVLAGGERIAGPYYQLAQFALFAWAMTTEDMPTVLPSVLVYAGPGTLLYLAMMRYAEPPQYERFMLWWVPYQATRCVAFALFVAAAWRIKDHIPQGVTQVEGRAT